MTNRTRLQKLAAVLVKAPDEVFIQPHNVPDPDAIAASAALEFALGELGIESCIVFDRAAEKTNSRNMLDLFDIQMRSAHEVVSMDGEDWTVLVDAQKGNANLTDLVTKEVAVIDHHERNVNTTYLYEDIRPDVGACSTIIAEYVFEEGIDLPVRIATALVYGILMDTDSLTRGADPLDIEMFYRLYSKADIRLINELKGNEISRQDLMHYAKAFEQVEIYGEAGFISVHNADDSLLGTASDIVCTIAGVNVVVAYSQREEGVKFSVRSISPRFKANDMVRALLKGVGFGGGHESMAGGFLSADRMPPDRSLDTFVRHRAISYLESVVATGGGELLPDAVK